MKPFIKVDRVNSSKEAKNLEMAGVRIVSVSLIEDPRFSDSRVLSFNEARDVRNVLESAKFCGEIGPEHWSSGDFFSMVKQLGFEYIQISGTRFPNPSLRMKLMKLGIGIIYAGIEVSYEDDPSWILSRFQDEKDIKASFFQLDLLPDMENSWDFLNMECPKYPEELQVRDINDLAIHNPLIVTTDISKGNIKEIADRLPDAQGIYMTLGDIPRRQDFHWFGLDRVFEILKHLR